MSEQEISTNPTDINLKKTEALFITWDDGHTSVYPIDYLRTMCPCASCKTFRENQARNRSKKKTSLSVLPGNYIGELDATGASLIGNYAIKIEFSDGHDTGIFSFEYLRQIDPG